MEKEKVRMFAYGTLMRGGRLHHLTGLGPDAQAVEDSMDGELYEVPDAYPIMTEGKGKVHGQVIEVNRKEFDRIRAMEESAGYETKVRKTDRGSECAVFMMPVNHVKSLLKDELVWPLAGGRWKEPERKRFIVKVQVSLASSDGVSSALVYSEDKSVMEEYVPAPAWLKQVMGGRKKLYCWATLENGSLMLQDEAGDQPW